MEERMSAFCFPKRANMAPGGGGGGSTGTKCGRWNPTTEQVKVLTDLFRSGLRTPSTDQIQKISSELSFYGKIENKNVFYWFQNHKARERQKRRRVSIDEKDVLRREDNVLRRDDNFLRREDSFSQSARYFGGISDQFGDQQERVLETLQLFPLHSFDDADAEKLRFHGNDHCKETTAFSYTFSREMDHPPLDLRLSFL